MTDARTLPALTDALHGIDRWYPATTPTGATQ